MAYVLINNLLKNAIKHNLPQGSLSITVNQNSMVFENTGVPLKSKPEELFQRFKKDSTSIDSSGLGLALIKKVCDLYKMKITYTVSDQLHRFEIEF